MSKIANNQLKVQQSKTLRCIGQPHTTMDRNEYLMLLQKIKDGFDNLWSDCCEAADEVELTNNDLYDELMSLAIDCEERMNKMQELINDYQEC